MEKSYETFVTDLRKLLLAAMDLKEEEIYFSNDGEKYGCLGDRLFVESGHMEKAKTVCGLHTEELYKRYCQEHSFENIVHDCVREIKKVSENCVLCDLDDLKDYVIKLLKHQISYNEFWALKDINFTLNKGDRLGILGLNGAGKSTLLKVIAGVLKATEGTVTAKGKIAPLLELGAGFDQQYTGRENIYLYGAVLGFSKKFLDEKLDEIIEFSELGKFIDVPVKNYSSGMKSRLGFSVATLVEPDILILDEVLSVGDAKFRKKSEAKIMSMFDKGVTVLFVSHSLDQVKRLCNKAILLEKGKIISHGSIEEVSKVYEEKTK